MHNRERSRSGKTTLFTPVIDLATAGEAATSYWRWFDTAVEAAIDDLTVTVFSCAGPCAGDLGVLLADWGCGS